MWSAASGTSDGADQVQLVLVGPVDVDLVGREERRAVHRLLAHAGPAGSTGDEALSRRGCPCALRISANWTKTMSPEQVDEARAARTRAALHVEHRRAARPARRDPSDSKSNTGGELVVAPYLDRVLVGEAVGDARVRQVRRGSQQAG